MKNKVINFYGCSFSHGGGLDNTKYCDYAKRNNLIVDSVSFETATDRHKFSKSCRFSTLVGKHFDCEVNNFSQTSNNNDNNQNTTENMTIAKHRWHHSFDYPYLWKGFQNLLVFI